jgi:RNA polymerase sigma-70 factor (ECF subfamily)
MAAHEEAALGELYDLTSGLIYALAMRMLRRPEDAEEATLDAYTRAWKNASSYDPGRGSVTAWLVIMVRSIAIDRIRAGATQAAKTAPLSDPAVSASDEVGPEASAWLGQQRRRVLEALDKLPVDQRRAIELAFYSGMSHTELAEATGVPLGTGRPVSPGHEAPARVAGGPGVMAHGTGIRYRHAVCPGSVTPGKLANSSGPWRTAQAPSRCTRQTNLQPGWRGC